MVSPVRIKTLDLLQRPMIATFARALSMEDIPTGVPMIFVAYLAEMELTPDPAHVQDQNRNMVVKPVRIKTLDLLQRPRNATFARALSMEDIPLGANMVIVAYLAEMEFNRGPEHAQIQKPNMVVSPARRTLDLIQSSRNATLDVALTAVAAMSLKPAGLEIAKKSSILWDLFAGSTCHQPVQIFERTQWIRATFILLKPANQLNWPSQTTSVSRRVRAL